MTSMNNLGGLLRRGFIARRYCTVDSRNLTEGEQKLIKVLKAKFVGATHVDVHDISGGCGSMYQIDIKAEEFRGKRMVGQHQMVNEALKEEIKDMHGLRITTSVPEPS